MTSSHSVTDFKHSQVLILNTDKLNAGIWRLLEWKGVSLQEERAWASEAEERRMLGEGDHPRNSSREDLKWD